MFNRTQLKEIILDQQQRQLPTQIIERELFATLEEYVKNPFVIILIGLRRVGKSTILQHLKSKYPGYYLNFDDERLIHFGVEDFQLLEEIFLELFGSANFFYFDEIQNITGWERYIRRLHDSGKKVFLTGSNATMLSKELGTHLTGRHLEVAVFPFSFREFLTLKQYSYTQKDLFLLEKKVKLKEYFKEYFMEGGLPEYLLTKNIDYLKTIYNNILYKDIIVRYKLPAEKAIKELVYYTANNVSQEISFNSIKKMLQVGSATTIKEYFDYVENSFLIFLVAKFDYSLKKQIYANKKMYIIDNALAIHLGFRLSDNFGCLLENLVFIELKRRKKEIYYTTNKQECDFVLKEGTKITTALQVCYELTAKNKEREVQGLLQALRQFHLPIGIILTYDQEEEFKEEHKLIQVIPVWKWLLQE